MFKLIYSLSHLASVYMFNVNKGLYQITEYCFLHRSITWIYSIMFKKIKRDELQIQTEVLTDIKLQNFKFGICVFIIIKAY